MCGFAGIISSKKEKLSDASNFIKSTESLHFRGPDKSNYIEGDNGQYFYQFVHKRLSIIDLSAKGDQPMVDKDKNTLVVNGEVYNYRELKKENFGNVDFISESDSEVMLKLICKYGAFNAFEKLDGMFAFAYLDYHKRELILGRDLFGKKPLYYYHDNETICFSSDIQSIWKIFKNKLTVNYKAIDYYLSMLSVPQPLTIWNEIKQVEPNSILQFKLKSNGDFSTTYRKEIIKFNSNTELTFEELESETEKLIQQAVKKRIYADVPIGCLLSGGVDSGLISTYFSALSSKKIDTYTVGFIGENNEFNEAREVAQKIGSNHHEIEIQKQNLEWMEELIDFVGEPFADSSIIPSHMVYQQISKYSKVALSGDGGDELFGGYDDYYHAFLADELVSRCGSSRVMGYTGGQLSKIFSRLNRNSINFGSSLPLLKHNDGRNLFTSMGFSQSLKKDLYTERFTIANENFEAKLLNELWDRCPGGYFDKMEKCSLTSRLLNDYLVKVDRASMFNSLEIRSPFLDKELASFAFSIPAKQKFRKRRKKSLLKSLGSSSISKMGLSETKKGFSIPLSEWFSSTPKSQAYNYCIEKPYFVQNLLNIKATNDLFDSVNKHKHSSSHAVFAIYCLELWARKYL